MNNHLLLKGKFIGFFKGNKTYISKWHLVDANVLFGLDNFGFLVGKIIYHNDIAKIKFLEDNSIMNFYAKVYFDETNNNYNFIYC